MGRSHGQAGPVPAQQSPTGGRRRSPGSGGRPDRHDSAAARYWQTAGAEVEAFDTLAAAPPHEFGDLPVIVIGAGRDVPDGPEIREVMDDLNRDAVSRTLGATYHVIKDVDHLSLLTVGEHARAVGELLAGLLPHTADQ